MGAAVVDHPEHPLRGGVRLAGHDVFDKPPERGDACGRLAAAEDLGAVRVPCRQVRQRPARVVPALDAVGMMRTCGLAGWQGMRAWREVFSSVQHVELRAERGRSRRRARGGMEVQHRVGLVGEVGMTSRYGYAYGAAGGRARQLSTRSPTGSDLGQAPKMPTCQARTARAKFTRPATAKMLCAS
jgi:hypothetical protein